MLLPLQGEQTRSPFLGRCPRLCAFGLSARPSGLYERSLLSPSPSTGKGKSEIDNLRVCGKDGLGVSFYCARTHSLDLNQFCANIHKKHGKLFAHTKKSSYLCSVKRKKEAKNFRKHSLLDAHENDCLG